MNDRQQSIEEIFLATLELPEARRRKEFLDRECDGALRAEVENFLSAHADAEHFFAELGLQLNHIALAALRRSGGALSEDLPAGQIAFDYFLKFFGALLDSIPRVVVEARNAANKEQSPSCPFG